MLFVVHGVYAVCHFNGDGLNCLWNRCQSGVDIVIPCTTHKSACGNCTTNCSNNNGDADGGGGGGGGETVMMMLALLLCHQ